MSVTIFKTIIAFRNNDKMSFRLPFWITVLIWKYTLIGLVAAQTGNKGRKSFMKQDEMKFNLHLCRILSCNYSVNFNCLFLTD